MRRSTVLSLPPQLVFLAYSYAYGVSVVCLLVKREREGGEKARKELLEQYFKRHPTTKFNKTPSAKYILL